MKLTQKGYEVGGINLLSIVKEHGSPVYVYDADQIVANYHTLKNAFKGVDVHLKYACKALTNISILKVLRKEGAGLDTVSIEEAKMGLHAGYEPKEILFTPNSVSFEEIREAVELGLVINIDELSTLERFGNEYGNKVPCCIRLNPHIMAGGNSHISVGHIDSKFGISIYQVPHIKRIVDALKINVNGLHMHTGSDILDAEVFLRGAKLLYEAAKSFDDLEFMDFGSGFKVKYKEGDITTDVNDIGAKIVESFKIFCKEYGRDLQLWFEPGKYLVSDAGQLLVDVNVVKQTTSTVFAGVNSGQNHLLRPMMYDAYHHITNISNPKGTGRIYSVVGYICESDTLGYDRRLNEVRVGDILAISNAGAYGFSMSSNYNSRLRPAEVMIYKGKAHLIRKRENLEYLLQNQVIIDLA
ncbi:MAG: diaminopimelate decarboxylase [Bacteroidia bacterium]|jgi:diaminopimelate decarboxylase|tara:strand:+ start:6090 stop:7325 length:1236 start_codon:yes stop_codon:yes gene_type:complete